MVRSFAGRAGLSIADQACAGVTTLATSVFVGRYVGVDALGLYAITFSISLLILQLSNAVVLEAFSVYGARRPPSESGAYLAFSVVLQVSWVASITAGGAAVACGLHAVSAVTRDDLVVALSALLYCNVSAGQQFMRRYFYLRGRQQAALLQGAVFLVFVLGGFACLYSVATPSLAQVYLVLTAASAVVCALQARQLLVSTTRPARAQVGQFAMEHWRYGRWVLASIPVVSLSFQGYYYILALLLSREEVGFFKAAETLVGPFTQVAMGLSMFLIPMVSRRIDGMSASSQRKFFARLTLLLVVGSLLYAALLLIFGETLMLVVFGGAVAEASGIIPVMAVVPVALAASVPAGVGLTALRRPGDKLLAYIASATATFALGIPLVHGFALVGAAWGLASSRIVFAAGEWVLLARTWRS